jgi:outer membrane protein assembly factor BamB
VCAFNTESCTLFTVDAKTGKQLWSWWLGDPLMSAPAVADGRVYTSYPYAGHGKASHVLAAFDLHTGKILWQKWIDSDVMSSPVAVDGQIWASTFAGTMMKLDARTGEILSARRSRATSAPTVVNGQVYFSLRTEGKGEEAREAVAAQDGDLKTTKYRAAEKKAAYVDAQAYDKSSYAQKGKQLDAANGFGAGAPAGANATVARATVGKDSVSTLQAHQGSRVVHAGGKNLSTMGDEVVALDPKTGGRLWSHKVTGGAAGEGGAVATAPAVAGGRLFIATLSGEVRQIDLATGALEKTYQVGSAVRSQPVVEEGWIYVGTEDGRVVGIATGDQKLSGWAQWGGNSGRSAQM